MAKKRVGIDINEVLRARWLQADRFYAQEFGEEGIPEDEYVYDIWNEYEWKDTVETIKELKEPDEMPDDINPLHYQVDEDGNSDADAFLFKPEETKVLTAREMYNRFMYEDFLFEIHGAAPKLYPQLDLDLNNFLLKYSDTVDFTVMSVENRFSIPPTLFFLSKIQARFQDYKFLENPLDMWKHVDVLITTNPEILKAGVPWGKKLIKLKRPYNVDLITGSMEALQVKDLIEDKEFQKIIRYKSN
jgi:hypothetical protein